MLYHTLSEEVNWVRQIHNIRLCIQCVIARLKLQQPSATLYELALDGTVASEINDYYKAARQMRVAY
jgi:hypothetical protein